MNIGKIFFAAALCAGISAGDAKENHVKEVFQPLVDEYAIPGAVTVVATKDKILDLSAVGWANVEEQKPMKKNTLFWVASQSKPVTAAAFMTLVDEGKVSPDDPVSKYIPEFSKMMVETPEGLKEAQNPILLRHLLTHFSGLPFAVPAENPTLDLIPLEERVKEYAKWPLASEPGTRGNYSNAGINTIGRVIEVVSGKPYMQFVQERILTPLKMTDTTFIPNKKQLERLAESYKTDEGKTLLIRSRIGQLRYPLDDETRQPVPAGGLFSTAEDMLKFCQMMANKGTFKGKKIMSEEAAETMILGGFGLHYDQQNGTFGHAGAFDTNMTVWLFKDMITIYLVQRDGSWPEKGNEAQKLFNEAAQKTWGKLYKDPGKAAKKGKKK